MRQQKVLYKNILLQTPVYTLYNVHMYRLKQLCLFLLLLGLIFWKANSRKVFAIPAPAVKKEVSVVDIDDADSDSEPTSTAVKSGINHCLQSAIAHGAREVMCLQILMCLHIDGLLL